MRKPIHCAIGCIVLFLTVGTLAAQDAAAIYQQACASCHDDGVNRAPTRDTLRLMQPERVLAALETGAMISMANRRSPADRRALAEFVTGKSFAQPLDTKPPAKAMCAGAPGGFANPLAGAMWNGWGVSTSNARYQPSPGFSAADVPRLKVKWAFGFPGDLSAYAQPVIAGGRVFTGSQSGLVYSLDAASGCIHWYFQATSGVRAAITIAQIDTPAGARYAALFGDQSANVYALDAATGAFLWKTKVDNYPLARVTGSPTFYNGRLYVGVAS